MNNSNIYIKSIGISINELLDMISSNISDLDLDYKISGRIKKESKIKAKLKFRNFSSILQLHDVYGVRVITSNQADAYLIYNYLLSLLDVKIKSDFIKSPIILNEKGFENRKFRCLRMVAICNKCAYEVQITTSKFHRINELHHKKYYVHKYDTPH